MSSLNIGIRGKLTLMFRPSSLAHKLLMLMFMLMLASQVRAGLNIYTSIIVHQWSFSDSYWSKLVTWRDSVRPAERDYINNSRHLARKYARIFVRGHYLFREANSFPRAKLEENCDLRGTDNVQGQISEHIFAPNGGYCLYYPSNLFRNARNFQNWGIFSDIPQF